MARTVSRKTVPCDCGCGISGPGRRMRPVRMTDGPPRRRGHLLYRRARTWMVLPGCVKPFAAELRAKERCRISLELMMTLPVHRRVGKLWSLFHLRAASLTRRTGLRAARRSAWSLVWFALRAVRTEKE